MANALSPEFTIDRVHIRAGPAWVKRFTGSAPWATPKFLRSLIGPTGCPTNEARTRGPHEGPASTPATGRGYYAPST